MIRFRSIVRRLTLKGGRPFYLNYIAVPSAESVRFGGSSLPIPEEEL